MVPSQLSQLRGNGTKKRRRGNVGQSVYENIRTPRCVARQKRHGRLFGVTHGAFRAP
jgi:hypothetical protein